MVVKMLTFETLWEVHRNANSERLSELHSGCTVCSPSTHLTRWVSSTLALAVLKPTHKGGKGAASCNLRSEYLNLKWFHSYFKECSYLLREILYTYSVSFRISWRCNPVALVDEPPMSYNFVRFNFIDMQLGYRKLGYFEMTACSKSPTETFVMRWV